MARAYSALHLVEAYFARRDVHHRSHSARNRAVNATFLLSARAYGNLQDASRISRYEAAGALSAAELEAALADFALIEA